MRKDTFFTFNLYSLFCCLYSGYFKFINQTRYQPSRGQSFQWRTSKTCWLVAAPVPLTRLFAIVLTFPQGPSESRPKYGSKSTNNPPMVPRGSSQLCPWEWQVQQNHAEWFTLRHCPWALAPSWAIPAGPGFCRGPLGLSPAPAAGLACARLSLIQPFIPFQKWRLGRVGQNV